MMRINLKLRCNTTANSFKTLTLFLLIAISSLAISDERSDEKNLAKLQQKIHQLQLELERDNKQKDAAIHELKLIEQAISKTAAKLWNVDNQLNTSQRNLKNLNKEQIGLENQQRSNRVYLLKQIRASYAMGKQEYVKLLLNQQDPSTVARMVVYYQYFNESRAKRIQDIDTSISRLNDVKQEINATTAELTRLRAQVVNDKKELNSRRKQRQQLVAKLSARSKKKGQALQALLRDEQHLKRLLDKLENELDDVELNLATPKDFKQLKGQLSWPAKGKLTARFGGIRNNKGNLKWKGIVIQTQPGESIRAIAYGRVVFADWLRGFGMLLIIDHGKGYMSLYGHNEQLHKKLGDWVQAKEVIATSGNSGGQETTSLYFEIRYKGIPQNPNTWCKSLPQFS